VIQIRKGFSTGRFRCFLHPHGCPPDGWTMGLFTNFLPSEVTVESPPPQTFFVMPQLTRPQVAHRFMGSVGMRLSSQNKENGFRFSQSAPPPDPPLYIFPRLDFPECDDEFVIYVRSLPQERCPWGLRITSKIGFELECHSFLLLPSAYRLCHP